MTRAYISGCQAVAKGAALSRIEVVAAYPITPQTSIVEQLAKDIAAGRLLAKMVHVEGEHSAMSVCAGASCVGARAFTATAGQGLAYMQEPLFWASGMRLPIVMAVTNRSLLAPNTIFCDHQDTLSQRDSGWIQLYAQNCQEALDLIPIAYRLSEHSEVLLPVMVCLDGFFLSHLHEPVEVPDPQAIDRFLLAQPKNHPQLDPDNPLLLNVFVPPDYYTEFEYDRQVSMQRAQKVLETVYADFEVLSGRCYSALETFHVTRAEHILVAMGSMVGTAKEKVKELRERGEAVGLVGVRTFRPFPDKELAFLLKEASTVGVLDRSVSFGSSGPLFLEVLRAINHLDRRPGLRNFILGLGGRDVNLKTINKAFQRLSDSSAPAVGDQEIVWLDLDEALCRSWGLEE